MQSSNRLLNSFQTTPLKTYLKFTAAFGAFAVVMFMVFSTYTIGINLSDSLPQKVFLIQKNASFDKGDYIQLSHQSSDEKFFKNGVMMVKQIIGSPGDKIEFKEREFFINGEHFGKTKPLSKDGRNLEQNKTKTLDKNEYFVYTPHKDSFDSRYTHMGYISPTQIVGKVVASW